MEVFKRLLKNPKLCRWIGHWPYPDANKSDNYTPPAGYGVYKLCQRCGELVRV